MGGRRGKGQVVIRRWCGGVVGLWLFWLGEKRVGQEVCDLERRMEREE
jgi:hypothetical protein